MDAQITISAELFLHVIVILVVSCECYRQISPLNFLLQLRTKIFKLCV